MKILIYSDLESHLWGGSETLWSRLASVLKQRGAEVAVTCFVSDQACQVCRENRISETMLLPRSAIQLPENFWLKVLNKLSRNYLRWCWRRFWVYRQRKFCERFSPNVVVVSLAWPPAGRALHPYLQKSGVPYICCLQYIGEKFVEMSADEERQAFYQGAFQVLVTGERCIGILEQWLGKPLANAVSVLNFVDVDSYMRKTSVASNMVNLLCVARLDVYDKGQDILLDVLSELVDLNWRLTLAGEGRDRHSLEEQVKRLRLENKVDFRGQVPKSDIPELLAAHDVFVLPSLNEGLPFSLLEAMASGLPCIATDVGSVREVLLHEETGLLIQPGNREQLKDALKRMIEDAALREQCAAAGYAIVKQKCDASKILNDVADLVVGAVRNC